MSSRVEDAIFEVDCMQLLANTTNGRLTEINPWVSHR
jgi:hypothetical protein